MYFSNMMMMMNCFCGMVDRRYAFNIISSRGHYQRFSTSQISDTPRAGFEPVQNLSPGFVEWNCVVVIITASRRHKQSPPTLQLIVQSQPWKHQNNVWNLLKFM